MEESTLSSVILNSSYTGITDNVHDYPGYVNQTYQFHTSSKRDSLYIVLPVTIIYSLIFVTGIIGNVSTCIVIARNKSMHTATNYYLFNLAVSDLLLLVSGLPTEVYLVWSKYSYIFGEGFCVLRGLAAETSTNASVLTITAFTVERYVAICHPFLSQTMSKLSRAIKLILIIWLMAFVFALPHALEFGVVEFEMNPDIVVCTQKRIVLQHSFELSTFLFFVVPMCSITVLYVLIGMKLRKSNMMKRNSGRTEGGRNCRHQTGRSSRRVVKMLVAVVIAFFICWAPFHVQRLIAIYGTNMDDHITSNSKWMEFLNLLLTYISGVLYYVSTTINPILYNIMSNKFRVAFMETLSRSCRVPGLAVRNEQRSYSSLSRSQQRALGAYGSRTVGTGTGIVPDSTECSGNPDESPKTSEERKDSKESRNSHGQSKDAVLKIDIKVTGGQRESKRDERGMRYTAVKVNNVDGNGKKWWRVLKWFPGLKALKMTRRTTYAVSENKILENPENREEFSMNVRNARESNEQRPL